jgi:hypothetical protein
MNRPESARAQSLEEILASIRKSLSDESTDGLSAPRVAPAATLAPAAKGEARPAPAAEAQSDGTSDGLSSRLAGALNGSDTSLEDELADFFAHVPKRTTPAGDAARPANAGNEAKDPFWFLTRGAAASESKSAQVPAAPASAGDGIPQAPAQSRIHI